MRVIQFIGLLIVSWCVMTFTHEMGHIIGGLCCGGTLTDADLVPWHLPYSFFNPDPYPLVTLWGGLILGVVFPLLIAAIIRRNSIWLIAHFCVLANGIYIATAWFAGDDQLDTPKLLHHGASPVAIVIYCVLTIGFGYVAFRRACIAFFSADRTADLKSNQSDSSKSQG